MKLYLIRHGESENNIKGCWTGWQNVDLTDKGVEDAKRARKFLESTQFDKIYSSDLMRAVKTAELVLPECTYFKTELLREINVGALSGVSFDTGLSNFGEDLTENIKNANYTPYGGESAEQFDARLNKFIKMIEKDKLENVIAFTHVGVIRRFVKNVVNLVLPADKVVCKNCAVAVLEYADDKWKLNSWINF